MLDLLRTFLSRAAGQAVLATILLLGALALLLAHIDVPVWWQTLTTIAVGFFFGVVIAKTGDSN